MECDFSTRICPFAANSTVSLCLASYDCSYTPQYRFVSRTRRFMDGYRKGLNGCEAVWASKKYRGHRVLPAMIKEEVAIGLSMVMGG